jgi:hypothetical protein
MPTLLETQRAIGASLLDSDDAAATALIEPGLAGRLDIYRNTFVIGVTKALRLTFPAVHRLVERRDTGVEVSRLDEAAWCFTAALCDGWSVDEALAGAAGICAEQLLAEHLAAGRFTDVRLASPPAVTPASAAIGAVP